MSKSIIFLSFVDKYRVCLFVRKYIFFRTTASKITYHSGDADATGSLQAITGDADTTASQQAITGDAGATASKQVITGDAGASPAVGLAQNRMNLQCLWRRRVSRRYAPQAHWVPKRHEALWLEQNSLSSRVVIGFAKLYIRFIMSF